jgi:hypothetical protein
MKALIQAMTLIAMSFVFNYNANAQSADAVEKVAAQKAPAHAEVDSLELYDGDQISVVQIRTHSNRAGAILGASQIELTSGEIIYPEEVRFAVVRGISDKNPHQKNPHQQN